MATNKKLVRIVPDTTDEGTARGNLDENSIDMTASYSSSVTSNPAVPMLISPDSSGRGIKQRLAQIDVDVDYLLSTTKNMEGNLSALNKGGDEMEHKLKTIVDGMRTEMNEKIQDVQQAANHRYDLQISENTRLQASVASLKAENSQLQKKLSVVLSRLDTLEGEVDSEKPSILTEQFSTTSLTQTSTDQRPKTVM